MFLNASSAAVACGGVQPLIPPQAWIQNTLDQQKRVVTESCLTNPPPEMSKSSFGGETNSHETLNGPSDADGLRITQELASQSRKVSAQLLFNSDHYCVDVQTYTHVHLHYVNL